MAFVMLSLSSACRQESSRSETETASTRPVEVATVVVQTTTVPLVRDLPGRLVSTRVAEVRARVSGIVLERAFEEGGTVTQGDVLFRIDPALYQAETDSAKATLERAEATRVQATKQLERLDTLLQKQAASQSQSDIARAARKQADADVALAMAQLTRAQLNLDFATVRAPISGRIGRALVTEGALVGQGNATHLVTIQQIDPIFVDFVQPASNPTFLRERSFGDRALPVRIILGDGVAHPDIGRLLFADVNVDPGTAQVGMRAVFPNLKGILLPGTYVRARIAVGTDAQAVVVPPQTIQRSSAGEAHAFVVDAKGQVVLRPIRTGTMTEAGWIVEQGLAEGETVIVEGFQKIQPGDVVNPVAWSDAGRPTLARHE